MIYTNQEQMKSLSKNLENEIYTSQEQMKSLNENLKSEFDATKKSIAGVETKLNFLFFVIPTAIGLIVGFNALQEFNRNLATGIQESKRIEEIRTDRTNKQKIEAYDQIMLERKLNKADGLKEKPSRK